MPVKVGKIHQVFSLASNFQHGARGWWIRFLLMASRVEDRVSMSISFGEAHFKHFYI